MDGGMKQAERGPWVGGYTSSVPAFMARPDQLIGGTDGLDTNSSRDCFIDPLTGGVSKRSGCAIQGDTVSSGIEVTGILNKKWGARARKLFGLDSPSMSDGAPVSAALYSEDTNAGFPAVDSGYPGVLYVRSSNGGGSNYTLLEEFGTTHYKQNVTGPYTSADFNLKVVPIWIDSGNGVYNRGAPTGVSGADQFMQQYTACGARGVLQTQNWLYSPNLRATPWRWNKRLNESSASGSEVVRVFPTGPLPPMFPPKFDSAALSAQANNSTWVDGDTFYVSCVFQFEDGSFSAPFIPRPVNATLTSGLGLVTVGTIGGANKYAVLTFRSVPIGPHGTIARIMVRTPKQNRTAAGDTITVSPLDLRVMGVLRNNTQSVFLAYDGDDDSLIEDSDVVRYDHVMPRRARYIGTGDQRVILSYTLPNTAAIELSLCNVNAVATANMDVNVPDTDAAPYNDLEAHLVRITSSQLELHYNPAAAPNFGGGGNAVAFTFATYDTIGKLVDAINATSTASLCKQWCAQVVPGMDDSMPSASLTLTSFDIAVTGTSSVTLTGAAADVLKVGVGMRVSGTNVTSGTYVVAKPSATTITISTATTGAPGATTTFCQETGDNAIVTGGTLGYLRAFGPGVPLLLHMKPSALPGYDVPDKSSVYYTNASPGAASSGMTLAPNSFLAANKNVPPASPRPQMRRMCTGIAGIEGAAIVAYTDGIYMFKNVRGANTGEDFDCRLFVVNDSRGCISDLGLISGNGWVAYPTTEGIVVTDKTAREFVISGDLFNPTDNTGDLAYEIGLSSIAAAADTENMFLSAAVMGSRIAVAFRGGGGTTSRVAYYDFSPGVEASGIEELLDPERKSAYIWSPPALYNTVANVGNIGAMGSFVGSSGRIDLVAIDSNAGVGDGRIDRVGTGTADNGTTFLAYATMVPVMASAFNEMSPQRVEVSHRITTGVAGLLLFANDQAPTFNTGSDYQRALPVSASAVQFQKQNVPIAMPQRGKCTLFWMQWRASTTANTSARVWRCVLEYDEVGLTNPTGST